MLHRKIRLLPFNLFETESFLKYLGIKLTRYDIVQLYMALGGVPNYLEKLNKQFSVAQNIDHLCFSPKGALNNEFKLLYASLFEGSERHMTLIKTLANSNKGLTRNDLSKKSGIPSGGDFSLKLDELIESGFVEEYPYYNNKKQLTLFRLSDEYSKFYLKFIANHKSGGKGTSQRLSTSQSYASWSGFAFETLCLKHIVQIKKSLRIDTIYSTNSSWFNEKAQVDLLIDRDDHVMNLCEMKFYDGPYTINKNHYLNIKNKIVELKNETKTRKNVFVVLITTYEVIENKYSKEIINKTLILSDLFTQD